MFLPTFQFRSWSAFMFSFSIFVHFVATIFKQISASSKALHSKQQVLSCLVDLVYMRNQTNKICPITVYRAWKIIPKLCLCATYSCIYKTVSGINEEAEQRNDTKSNKTILSMKGQMEAGKRDKTIISLPKQERPCWSQSEQSTEQTQIKRTLQQLNEASPYKKTGNQINNLLSRQITKTGITRKGEKNLFSSFSLDIQKGGSSSTYDYNGAQNFCWSETFVKWLNELLLSWGLATHPQIPNSSQKPWCNFIDLPLYTVNHGHNFYR